MMPDKLTLRQHRLIKGITQKELADSIGVHETTYLKIERDPNNAKVSNVKAICKALGISIDELIFFNDESN